MRFFISRALTSIACASAGLVYGQTQLSLRDQARNIDFSQAVETRPLKTGTVLPAVCAAGDLFFKSDAPPGQNVYGCTSTNIWTLEAGGGTSGGSGTPGDFAISNSSSTVLAVGANCSSVSPCNFSDNNVPVLALTGPCTITLGGAVSSGSVYVFVSSTGVLTAGHNSGATLTPNANCTVVSGVVSFPDGSTPIAVPAFTSNAWAAVTPAMDKRAVFSANTITAGTGISTSVNGSSGLKTVATDATIIPQYSNGSGVPAGSCATGRDFYTDTTNGNLYWCKAANTWQQVNGSGGGGGGGTASHITNGNYPAPGTCAHTSTDEDFYKMNQGVPIEALCTSTNTWTYYFSGASITPAALLTGLATNLQSGVTENHANGYSVLTSGAGTSSNLSWVEWTAPTPPYTRVIYIRAPFSPINVAANSHSFSVGLMDGSGKQLYLLCGANNGSVVSSPSCDVRHGTSGGFTGEDVAFAPAAYYSEFQVVLTDDGTNLKIGVTTNGSDPYTYLSQGRTVWMPSGPTKLFVAIQNSASDSGNSVTLVGVH
jgi:hypothetical protein